MALSLPATMHLEQSTGGDRLVAFQLARISAKGVGASRAPGRPERPERISPNKARHALQIQSRVHASVAAQAASTPASFGDHPFVIQVDNSFQLP